MLHGALHLEPDWQGVEGADPGRDQKHLPSIPVIFAGSAANLPEIQQIPRDPGSTPPCS
ncbi:hypothetical protein VD0004_g8628 [Verticillium dahliae]|uniref:Uncharacterized protein n=1 Tax=Verticillium dahliae TaxID=27337 RepID=A0AA44WTD0_VERDA|nr:hypothetical protein BJF96_g1361 [Verticillium dahliae]PNH38192.1 hypothetical protein VD0004_g8628 [Verticillium dahliae]PNH72857.1 hypothetical protein VD0001_g4690 [Verticillium dahliae]